MSEKKLVQPSDIPPLANAFSGAVGGAVANLLVFPLDLITTRLQIQSKVHTDEKYDGVADALVKIYRSGGISDFYDGALSDTVATTAQAFFYFFAYEGLRSRRMTTLAARNGGRAPSTLHVGEELAIGSLAGIFAKFFISPLNNIVARQQAAGLVGDEDDTSASPKSAPVGSKGAKVPGSKVPGHHHHLTAQEVVKAIYRERGVTGFWSGYKATVLLSANPSLTYYFFQVLKTFTLPRHRRDNPTSSELFFLAAFAKTLATLITYPVILVKTRIQVVQDNKGDSDKASVVGQISNTLSKDGFRGLYTGARSQILKGFFSQGITMMTKDQIARLIIYLYFATRKYRRA